MRDDIVRIDVQVGSISLGPSVDPPPQPFLSALRCDSPAAASVVFALRRDSVSFASSQKHSVSFAVV